jgi:zinc transporter 2
MSKLITVTAVSFIFMICQGLGGWISGSIAIFTDCAHLMSDLVGFFISIISIRMAQRSATSEFTYGWHRAEVLGSLSSIIVIWVITLILVYEATVRLVN